MNPTKVRNTLHSPQSHLAFIFSAAFFLIIGTVNVSAQPDQQASLHEVRETTASEAFSRIDRLAEAELLKDGIGGLSLGLIVDGVLAHQSAFGVADIESSTPARTDHVYRIGSITKQFTALALQKLAHSGKLKLSDPVAEYVPEIASVEGYEQLAMPISLIELATMTSGLAREPRDLPSYLVGPASDWSSVVRRALPEVRFDFEPDTRYQYSNIGYAIVGVAVANAAERPFMDYVRDEFLSPLGMKDSDFVPRDSFRDRIASGYAYRDGEIDADTPAKEHRGRGYKVPNGALYSTVSDLSKFVQLQMSLGPEPILPRKLLAENLTRVNSADGQLTSGYGLGFRVERRGELVIFGHGGSVAGYRAGCYFDPTRKLGVVLLRNVTGSTFDVTDVAFQVMEILVAAESSNQ